MIVDSDCCMSERWFFGTILKVSVRTGLENLKNGHEKRQKSESSTILRDQKRKRSFNVFSVVKQDRA